MAELLGKFDDHHDYIWRCDCGDSHFLQVSWDDKDSEWRFLDISDTYQARRWRDRIGMAFRMLRGKPYHAASVLLDERNVNDVLAVLSKHAKEA